MKSLLDLTKGLLTAIILILTGAVFSSNTTPNFIQKSFYNLINAKYICVYEGESTFETDFYFINSLYSTFNGNERNKADLLMLKDNNLQFLDGVMPMQYNEVIVSENYLGKGVELGQYINVKTPQGDDTKQYLIVGKFATCYGLTNDYIDTDKAVIIFGYDEYITSYSTKSLALINDETVSTNNLVIDKWVEISKRINSLDESIHLQVFLIFLVFLVMNVVNFFIFSFINKESIKRTIVNGRTKINLFYGTYLSEIVTLFIVNLVSILGIILVDYVRFSAFASYLFYLLFCVLIFITIMILDIEIRIKRT